MALTLPSLPGSGSAPAVRLPSLEGSFGSLDVEKLRARMLRLTVDMRLVPGVDVVELVLPPGQGVGDLAAGNPVELSLGFGDGGATKVFTGTVEAVIPSIGGTVRVTATDGGAALAALRLERSYESMSAGDVVKDLLGEVGISAGTVDSGSSLPFYAVGRGMSALAWVEALTRSHGFVAFVDGAGAFHFASPAGGSPVATFGYGRDVLALSVAAAPPVMTSVTVVGEGAAGSQGQDAWAWLIKDPAPATATAGSGTPARTVSDGSVRSAQGATASAEGRVAASAREAKWGELVVPGAPAATPGSTVAVTDTPDGALDGNYLVLRVRHRIDARRGLRSELTIAGPDGGGGLGGLL